MRSSPNHPRPARPHAASRLLSRARPLSAGRPAAALLSPLHVLGHTLRILYTYMYVWYMYVCEPLSLSLLPSLTLSSFRILPSLSLSLRSLCESTHRKPVCLISCLLAVSLSLPGYRMTSVGLATPISLSGCHFYGGRLVSLSSVWFTSACCSLLLVCHCILSRRQNTSSSLSALIHG